MRRRDFTPQCPGKLVDDFDGRASFVPEPLPPKLTLTATLIKAISDVSGSLGRLDGTAQTLPDPKVLIRTFVRREAQLSSYIENTYARYDEVADAERAGDDAPVSEPVRETRNAERTILAGVKAVITDGAHVNNALIRRLHAELLDRVRGHESRGQFRQKPVYIGREELGADHARFVPPPFHLLIDLMDAFEDYLEASDDLPSLVRIGLQHYQFETIHPFEDGNGRLGRTLILLGLCQHGHLSVPVLNASLHFERNRQDYYDALLRVSTHGDWNGWLEFFLEGIRVAANESNSKLRELLDLQRWCHSQVRTARNSALLLTIVDRLFVTPVVTIPLVQKWIDVTYASAKSSVDKLVDLKILRPLEGFYPARFLADSVLIALNAEPTRR